MDQISYEQQSSSSSSTLSTAALQSIIENLRTQKFRNSTKMNYYGIWKNFNQFFLKLDVKPDNWEDRLSLYIGYLVENNRKSATIKSYISAIKAVLLNVNVELSEDKILLSSLTKACKLWNDRVQMKLIILCGFLNILIKKVDLLFRHNPQPYLTVLYKALLSMAYFGLFRIGEITKSPHVVEAANVHIGQNKNKLMFILHTSKTHGLGAKPQIIKISAVTRQCKTDEYCPFVLLCNYVAIRKKYLDSEEQFFVFRDHSPVLPSHFRNTLSMLIRMCRLNPKLYSSHSLRSGQASVWESRLKLSKRLAIGDLHRCTRTFARNLYMSVQ